ncbi:MAG TPA: lytic transglycosylase domain-containing protein [Anaerolineales bacterium]|nr:lytic transglycosylase domain-containing protein [Anaerolineales bacterium]
MAITWLPYASSGRPGSLPRRPSAPSLRPAVVIPLAVASVFMTSVVVGLFSPRSVGVPPLTESAPDPAPSTQLPTIFAPSVRAWSPEINRWSQEYDLPPDFVAVVMTLESCGNPGARSSAGALGLFQVMPFHFDDGEDPLDPEVNARRGLSYLRRALDLAQGDFGRAMAGYNGGHGVIDRDASTWAAETRRYQAWGAGIMEDLDAGRVPSPTLEAWLDAGGRSLCHRAES